MKHVFFSVAIVALLGAPNALAAPVPHGPSPGSTPAQVSKVQAPTHSAGKTHLVSAEFVSYDTKARIVTIKDDKGQTSTAPLEGRAIREVAQLHLKTGDHVMMTCRDNAQGEHQAVTEIKASKAKG